MQRPVSRGDERDGYSWPCSEVEIGPEAGISKWRWALDDFVVVFRDLFFVLGGGFFVSYFSCDYGVLSGIGALSDVGPFHEIGWFHFVICSFAVCGFFAAGQSSAC